MSTRGNPAALDIGIEALKVAGMNFPSRNLAVHTVVSFFQVASFHWAFHIMCLHANAVGFSPN